MRLQSAIFDLDGTLIGSMVVWKQVADQVFRDLGLTMDDTFWDKTVTMPIDETCEYIRKNYGVAKTTAEIRGMMESRMWHYYRCEAKPKPGLERFLSILKMEGVWMYVATATDRAMVEAALKCAGIADYFRGIVTCEEAGAEKGVSPAVYEHAMTRLRSNKKDTVIFEDSLTAIRTAKAAGFRVAGVYDEAAEANQAEIQRISDYYIRSFEEMSSQEDL